MAHPLPSLPTGCHLRPAKPEDIWAIRKLVFSAALDPTQIRWSQFWIIEANHQVIACGQLREFPEAQELGSLVVSRRWQGHGLGTFLTQHLIQQANQPLYLECLGDRLAHFYTKQEFSRINWQHIPPGLKRKFRLSYLGHQLLRLPVVFMYRPPH